jgi:hypothetical protein
MAFLVLTRSLARFSAPTEVAACHIMLAKKNMMVCVCGEECLIIKGLTVDFPRHECKCHLSAVVCILYATCSSLPARANFRIGLLQCLWLCNCWELYSGRYEMFGSVRGRESNPEVTTLVT